MDIEDAERLSKHTGRILTNALERFLQKSPIEKVELIVDRLGFEENQLYPLIIELIEDLKNFDSSSDLPHKWEAFDSTICNDIDRILQIHFTDFLYFIVLQTLLDSSPVPLKEEYKKDLIRKHKLTSKKIQQFILAALGRSVFQKEIKRGGSEGFWNDRNRLEFLALYNRFLILIKNARADVKILVRQGKSESTAEKEILAKYEIPEILSKSAFSAYDAPKETALDWAKQKMKLKFNEDYLRDILTGARNLWRSKSRGLIGKKTLEEHPKIQLILVDINFEIGCRYYAVSSINKDKMKKLKYVTVAKKLNGKLEIRTDEESEEFLVKATF